MSTQMNRRVLLVAALLTAGLLGGCPSDDDSDDDACTRTTDPQCNIRVDAGSDIDANPLQPDADVTAPDASIDANGDPCAPYYALLEGDWTCHSSDGLPVDCTMAVGPYEGKCFLGCGPLGCDVTPEMTGTNVQCIGVDWTCYR